MVFSIWYLTICALCSVQCASLHIGSGAAWSQYPYTNPYADLLLFIGNGFAFGNDNGIGFGDCESFGVSVGNGFVLVLTVHW